MDARVMKTPMVLILPEMAVCLPTGEATHCFPIDKAPEIG